MVFDLDEKVAEHFRVILEKRKKISNLTGDKKGLMLEKGLVENLESQEEDFEDQIDELQTQLTSKDFKLSY